MISLVAQLVDADLLNPVIVAVIAVFIMVTVGVTVAVVIFRKKMKSSARDNHKFCGAFDIHTANDVGAQGAGAQGAAPRGRPGGGSSGGGGSGSR